MDRHSNFTETDVGNRSCAPRQLLEECQDITSLQLAADAEVFEKRSGGRYRYRRALLEVPKGNGKTSLAAWIGAYQLATQHSAVIPVASRE